MKWVNSCLAFCPDTTKVEHQKPWVKIPPRCFTFNELGNSGELHNLFPFSWLHSAFLATTRPGFNGLQIIHRNSHKLYWSTKGLFFPPSQKQRFDTLLPYKIYRECACLDDYNYSNLVGSFVLLHKLKNRELEEMENKSPLDTKCFPGTTWESVKNSCLQKHSFWMGLTVLDSH